MNMKKLAALLLAVCLIACCLSGCSEDKPAGSGTTTAPSTELEVIDAPDVEVIAFAVNDSGGNELTLIPIFDTDAETIVAGYVLSAKDKNGKALDSKEYSLLGSVLSASQRDGKLQLDTDSNKAPIEIETYADEKGTLIAIKDIKDLNGNKNSDELLKLNKRIDSNDVNLYVIEYTTVTVKKSGEKYELDFGGTKVIGSLVNAKNETVAQKLETEKKKNEIKKKNAEKNKTTTTAKTPAQTSTTNMGEVVSPEKETTTEPEAKPIGIVLKRNGGASTDSKKAVSIDPSLVTIKMGGDYEITSETDDWHGQIVVKLPNTEKCEIRFINVNISYNKGNILQIIDTSIDSKRTFLESEGGTTDIADDEIKNVADNDHAPNVDLSFPTGTKSTFHSTANSYTGVIYNESKLMLKGNGALTVESRINADNCICTTKSLTMKNLSLEMTTSSNDVPSKIAAGAGSAKGIFSYSKVTVESGNLTIKSNGDSIRCDKFFNNGATVNLSSSACDGIDADDAIELTGGSTTVVALEKSAFKVRRVNAGNIRSDKDTFKIDGGTVIGESSKMTAPISAKQASLLVKLKKAKTAAAPDTDGAISTGDSKKKEIISIKKPDGSALKKSANICTKLLYSSSAVKKGTAYEVAAGAYSAKMTASDWNGTIGLLNVYCANQ